MSIQDLTRKWTEVRQLVPQRDSTLQAELRKQQSILFTVMLRLLNYYNLLIMSKGSMAGLSHLLKYIMYINVVGTSNKFILTFTEHVDGEVYKYIFFLTVGELCQ